MSWERQIHLKSPAELETMREAGKINATVLATLRETPSRNRFRCGSSPKVRRSRGWPGAGSWHAYQKAKGESGRYRLR